MREIGISASTSVVTELIFSLRLFNCSGNFWSDRLETPGYTLERTVQVGIVCGCLNSCPRQASIEL